jgi:SNF2 family DNA or RNA helicase
MADDKFNALVDEWNEGKYQVIYGHPKSMSHGMNLQGGGFDIIFFGLTWSLDRYQQAIGRLRRNGQPNDTVFVHRIACHNTVEDLFMLPRLKKRSESQREFLQAFNRYKQLA